MNRTKKGRCRIIKCDMERLDEKEAYEKLEYLAAASGLPIRKIFSLLMKSISINGFCLSIKASLNTQELTFATGLESGKTQAGTDGRDDSKESGDLPKEASETKTAEERSQEAAETKEYKGYKVLDNGMLLGKDGKEISRFIADLQAEEASLHSTN